VAAPIRGISGVGNCRPVNAPQPKIGIVREVPRRPPRQPDWHAV